MSTKKIIRQIIAASSPLISGLNRKNPSVLEITFGAQKALPGLHRAAVEVARESIQAVTDRTSDNYGALSVVLDQAIVGAQMIANTPPNEVMATYSLPEAQRYREGIAIFSEAFIWIQSQ